MIQACMYSRAADYWTFSKIKPLSEIKNNRFQTDLNSAYKRLNFIHNMYIIA